jgi:hypothetical protein
MRPRAILGVLLLGALALRLAGVGDTLSHDEGYTWLVSSAHGPGALLDRLNAYENTPPLYYLLTWPLPDDGVAWLRVVAVLAGVGCVAAAWWIADAMPGNFRTTSVRKFFSAAALAVAPFAVSYSDYARGFILADFGLLIALGAAMRRNWWLYGVGAAIALYAEYDSALFLLAVSFVAGWRALLPIALLIPWLPQIHDTPTKVAPVYPNPSAGTLRDTIVRLTFGEHGTANATSLRWLQFLLVAAVCVWAFRKAPKIIGTAAIGTLVLHAVTHWIGPDVFAPRYLTELIPLGAIAIGCAVAQSPRRIQVGAAIAIAARGAAVGIRRAGENDEPDYKAIANAVAPAASGRTVLTNSAVIVYYLRDLHPHLDRPFGLKAPCRGCRPPFLVVDDTRVANSPRSGPGGATTFGPIYVRAG